MGELVEGTFDVRILAFMGTSGLGHAEVVLKSCEDTGFNVIGLQEARRDGQSAFTAAVYVAFLLRSRRRRRHEKNGNHGMSLAVRESIVAGMDKR